MILYSKQVQAISVDLWTKDVAGVLALVYFFFFFFLFFFFLLIGVIYFHFIGGIICHLN